mmetsp:Transcript_9299/g.18968  ORF Transcript_9299/g.18968 Transcript_9299/m.18968 type:complete len:1308 (-) Transcript_9299:270-4193(-)|eukprot:CAMPEP_0184689018 /NCGR_PEP_ID=MMETSP0312-20130426/30417_1 /TAXON_ID=31354 /ORGANISM="Compsopogon coeruleus, Strain SAG 36.94" /LENGTH=1307 /DNA_ID=CAMNT_0027146307 /DNA_START=3614 /DNA_END=7537 /DNA_ORIENTATION=-
MSWLPGLKRSALPVSVPSHPVAGQAEQNLAKSPEHSASLASLLFWCWVGPLLRVGAQKPLDEEDLYVLPEQDRANHNAAGLRRQLESVARTSNNDAHNAAEESRDGVVGPRSMLQMLWADMGGRYLKSLLWQPLWTLSSLGQVYLVRELVTWVSSSQDVNRSPWRGILLVLGMGLSGIGMSLAMHHTFHRSMRWAMRVRASLSAVVYEKLMRLNNRAMTSEGASSIVTILNNDTQRIVDALTFAPFFFAAPPNVILISVILISQLGVSAVFGTLTLILVFPLQIVLGGRITKLRAETLERTDRRVTETSELLSGIRIVKYGAWEEIFAGKIRNLREEEFRWLLRGAVYEAVNNSLFFSVPTLVSLVTFAAYTLMSGNALSPEVAFPAVALFNLLSRQLIILPRALRAAVEGRVAFQRIDKYLTFEEVEAEEMLEPEGTDALKITEASFSWVDGPEKPTLEDISLVVPPGGFLAVVGRVGSGKSSLLMSICGELKREKGQIRCRGRLSLATQVPWILNASFRENVICASGDQYFDERRYWEVLRACCLDEDVLNLPAGDLTEIGERGVNLSGGQRARLSLARACYTPADVYLVDDPFSSVDPKVATKIFQRLLGQRGILAQKTRIVVTHNLRIIRDMDSIIVMENGRIAECGSYSSLKTCKYFNQPESSWTKSHKLQNSEVSSSEGCLQALPDSPTDFDSTRGKLTTIEDRNVGKVTRNVYLGYIRAAGGLSAAIFSALAFSIAQAARQVSDWWLSEWSTDSLGRPETSGSEARGNRFYVIVYAGLTAATIILSVARIALFMIHSLTASKSLHDTMLNRITHATQAFFDVNPTGRILNRFARDVDLMDYLLPLTAADFLQAAFIAIGALLFIAVIFPWFLVAVMPIALSFYYFERIYASSARELKRLEGITRSPIYSQFSETCSGLETIRAFRLQDKMSQSFMNKVDRNHQSYYLTISASRWLGVRLDFLSTVVVVSTSIIVLALNGTLNPGLAGVALTQSLLLTGIFQWAVRQAAETENYFTSVERVLSQICGTTQEEEPDNPQDVPENWPEQGQVEFRDVSMRYRPELPLVLREMSFETLPAEKIGIVGRTGAGKSSITGALFRMVPCEKGAILIDGVDIAKIRLVDLRRRLAIVPQEPVLFNGSVRSNLDCLGRHRDSDLWEVLKSVQLDAQGCLSHGLDTEVVERGSNFSVGERQLLCLARALLVRAKVVILDEATAAVDNLTDSLMQTAIRTQFSDCTVLNIAHRQSTIADSNRVLVVANGGVDIFDSPSIAIDKFNDKNSYPLPGLMNSPPTTTKDDELTYQ